MNLNLIIVSTVFVLLTLIGAITLTQLGKASLAKTNKGGFRTFSFLLHRANVLRIATVYLIIYATIVLVVIAEEKINDTALSILSGIAGFVLGGINISGNEKETDDKGE